MTRVRLVALVFLSVLAVAMLPAAPALAAPAAAAYFPVTPTRLLDTRATAPLGPGTVLPVAVAGHAGVSPTASAVVMNVTAVDTSASSYLTLWAAGGSQPVASSLNWLAGQLVANLVTVPLGTGGAVAIYNASGNVDVVLDVEGYFEATAGGAAFHPLMPARVLDTRSGLGRPAGQVSGAFDLQLAGAGNVPSAGATAVVLNLTVTNPASAGYVTAYPAGVARPLASNVNFGPGRTVANRAIVQLSATGSITLFCSCAAADIVVDVNGYFTPAAPGGTEGLFVPLSPTRILDSRSNTGAAGPIGAAQTATLTVLGAGNVPASGVGAVVLNLTATDDPAPSYVTAFPSGGARVLASDVNFLPGAPVPNLAVVKPGAGGAIALFNDSGATNLVGDVVGYFTTIPDVGTAPGAPQSILATAGDRGATVSWQPPASDGGTAITSYEVDATPGGGSLVVAGSQTSAAFSRLTNQTTYTFTVTAVNGTASGPAGTGATATPVGTPDAPVAVVATPQPGYIAVSWTPPANNGGFPITSYVITMWPGGATAGSTGTAFGWGGIGSGTYWFTVQAVNQRGAGPASAPSNTASPISLRKIVVSLSKQHLWAYQGSTLLMDTPVATGRPELPTPTGDYHIMNKQSPYEFISPWPLSSPYYYPPSWVNYAMEFIPGGYYLHDAPWRSWYGPGANLFDGTHGCVNIPLSPMTWLYGWAQVGDEVVVQN